MLPDSSKYSLLCLGDSYTIGEAVMPEERFSYQAVDLLKAEGVNFSTPEIIAKTGWTTDELMAAIRESEIDKSFDFVTLLIGVNNQYRGRDIAQYKEEFNCLLQKALMFAGQRYERVIVLSIPDWGVTPFVAQDTKKRSSAEIAAEIDMFNAAQRSVCEKYSVSFIDITDHSRQAKSDRSLIANDGLHPSGKMYAGWAKQLATCIINALGR